MTPNRMNRAHWPTKENRQHLAILGFCPSMEKLPGMALNGTGKVFFPADPDLADILGDVDLDFENFNF